MSEPDLRKEVQKVAKIANAVVHVAKAMKELEAGKLNEKAITVLLAHSTGLSEATIKKVLTGLSDLEKMYLKP